MASQIDRLNPQRKRETGNEGGGWTTSEIWQRYMGEMMGWNRTRKDIILRPFFCGEVKKAKILIPIRLYKIKIDYVYFYKSLNLWAT